MLRDSQQDLPAPGICGKSIQGPALHDSSRQRSMIRLCNCQQFFAFGSKDHSVSIISSVSSEIYSPPFQALTKLHQANDSLAAVTVGPSEGENHGNFESSAD